MPNWGGRATRRRVVVAVAVAVLTSCGSAERVAEAPVVVDTAPIIRVPDSIVETPSISVSAPASEASVPTEPSTSPDPTAVGPRDDLALLTKFTWYLYGIVNSPAGIGPFAPGLSIRFTPSDTPTLDVAIDLGCRFGTGQVVPSEDGLMTVSEFAFTEQSCDSDEAAVADVVVSAFGQPLKWSVQDHVQLTLESADGAGPTLQWRQTPDGTPATEPSTP